MVEAASAVVDFIYFALLHSHTTTSLLGLKNALDSFHANKHIFMELEARNPGHFNAVQFRSIHQSHVTGLPDETKIGPCHKSQGHLTKG
jgi:hypothetical protein